MGGGLVLLGWWEEVVFIMGCFDGGIGFVFVLEFCDCGFMVVVIFRFLEIMKRFEGY